jgi:hypothetical protein
MGWTKRNFLLDIRLAKSIGVLIFIVLGIQIFCFRKFHKKTPSVRFDEDKPQVLAFYFPQYHPIPENDRFWGKGFTEWTMVRKCLAEQTAYADVVAPSEEIGFYDLRDKDIRKKQGGLGRKYGLDGFIYYHYWFGSEPVMAEVLERLLEDGEPNLKFCLCWANENWSRRWDGGNRNILLEQTYDQSTSRKHYDFLKRFWLHRLHLRKNSNLTPFFVYMTNGKHGMSLYETLGQWKKWWFEETGGYLHIVQILGSPGQHQVVSWVDAVAEFEPAYTGAKNAIFDENRYQRLHQCQYAGSFSGWDNSPRHVNGGGNSVYNNLHMFYSSVLSALTRSESLKKITPQSCFNLVLLNAWNEWGERNVLEPDIIHGTSKLKALKRAITRVNDNNIVPIRPRKESVCFVVRTFLEHRDHPFFNISMLIESFRNLPISWEARLLVTDEYSEGYRNHLIKQFSLDSRIHVPNIPDELPLKYDGCLSAYHLTDWGIRQCSEDIEWVVVTNGDNSYGKRSFANMFFADEKIDMVLLPAVSRYFRWNYFHSEKSDAPNCEEHVQSFASPLAKYGVVDLGGVAIRRSRLIEEDVFFTEQYPRKCSSLDWFTVERLLESGWRYLALAPPGDDFESFFMHNPNPWTCGKLGGVWSDSSDFKMFGCLSKQEAMMKGKVVKRMPLKGEHYDCVESNEVEWANTPSDQIMCSPVVSEIATQILRNAKSCGLEFDEPFYNNTHEEKAEMHWISEGFCKNREYRFLRKKSFKQSVFVSEKCFLVRAFSSRKIVSFPRVCKGSEKLKLLILQNMLKSCAFILDEPHYFENHEDVMKSGLRAEAHFWDSGFIEGRTARAYRDEAMKIEAGMEIFCEKLPKAPHINDFARLSSVYMSVKTICVKDSSLDPFSTNNCGMPVNMVLIPDRNGTACTKFLSSE